MLNQIISTSNSQKLFIYGAGELGIFLLNFAKNNNVKIFGCIDQYSKQSSVNGVQIFTPDEVLDEDALIIEGIFNPSKINKSKFKTRNFINTRDFLNAYSLDGFKNFCSLANPNFIKSSKLDFPALFSVFDDVKSNTQLQRLIDFQLGNTDYNFVHDELSNLYFDPELIKNDEVITFMDCGAFNGDTIKKARNFFGVTLANVIAIEPSQAFLNSDIETFCISSKINLHYFSCGLSDVNAFNGFSSAESVSDAISADSKNHFWFSRLDDLPLLNQPNFIKFDIEGSELVALKGGVSLFNKSRPILAISLYHNPLDFYEIPLYLSQHLLDYKFYFRQYADNCWETVLYAIPKRLF